MPRSRVRRVMTVAPVAILGAALALWVAIHRLPWLGPALADGARAVFGPAVVAWAEDTAYGLQDRWDRWRHGDDAPSTYWNPGDVAASPAPGASDGASAQAPGFPPAPAAILFPAVAAPGDGRWVPAQGLARPDGTPIMVKTMVHPDRERPYTVLALVAMDVSQISLHAVPGTVEPHDPTLPEAQRPGMVAPSDVDTLLAAFNGGFQTIHGRYGMMVDGHRLLPPQDRSCTVAIYRDGRVAVAPWTELASTEPQMAAFRQTPECLVHAGVRHPELENMYATSWGAVVGGKTVIRRSALGLSKDGRTLFFGMGDSLTARTLADGMMAAGAHDVAQLDVNHVFPRFVFFERRAGTGVVAGTPLCGGFSFSPSDYVRSPMLRDFFYVTRRQGAS
jgi:hypothetical protein